MTPMHGVPATRDRSARRRAHHCGPLPAGVLTACAWALLAALAAPCPSVALAQGLEPPAGTARTAQTSGASAVAPAASVLAAQEAPAEGVHLKSHAIVFGAGAATLAALRALQPRLAPASCRWCDVYPDGSDALNGLDRAARERLRWQRPNAASTISDVVAYGITPAVVLGLDYWAARESGRSDAFKVDALVIGEAAVLASNATQALKYLTARQRPYAHARALGQPAGVNSSSSDNFSFSSGHTAMAFAMAVSAARVMTLRRYSHAGWAWGLGLSAAAAVGYFRVAADRHYLTDVLAAAGIGTAMGLIVPRLALSRRPAGADRGTGMALAPYVSGPSVGITWTW